MRFQTSLILITVCLLSSNSIVAQKNWPVPKTDTYSINSLNPSGDGYILSNLNFSSKVTLDQPQRDKYLWHAIVYFKSCNIDGYVYNGVRYSKSELMNDFGLTHLNITSVTLRSVVITFNNGKSFNSKYMTGLGARQDLSYIANDEKSDFNLRSISITGGTRDSGIEGTIKRELFRKEQKRENEEFKKKEEERIRKLEEEEERLAEIKREEEIAKQQKEEERLADIKREEEIAEQEEAEREKEEREEEEFEKSLEEATEQAEKEAAIKKKNAKEMSDMKKEYNEKLLEAERIADDKRIKDDLDAHQARRELQARREREQEKAIQEAAEAIVYTSNAMLELATGFKHYFTFSHIPGTFNDSLIPGINSGSHIPAGIMDSYIGWGARIYWWKFYLGFNINGTRTNFSGWIEEDYLETPYGSEYYLRSTQWEASRDSDYLFVFDRPISGREDRRHLLMKYNKSNANYGIGTNWSGGLSLYTRYFGLDLEANVDLLFLRNSPFDFSYRWGYGGIINFSRWGVGLSVKNSVLDYNDKFMIIDSESNRLAITKASGWAENNYVFKRHLDSALRSYTSWQLTLYWTIDDQSR